MPSATRLPSWFRQDIPDTSTLRALQQSFRQRNVHTVCESARCPNWGQCWSRGVATFMILGDTCTRACRFCGVATGTPCTVDSEEPYHVAGAVKQLRLNYAVITSVSRDDLDDGGAAHFAQTVAAIRATTPQTNIEVLIPDFLGNDESLRIVVNARPEVIAHNTETVPRLSKTIRPQADYQRSLTVLQRAKQIDPSLVTKSGFSVGLGETVEEIHALMHDLRRVGCDILTIGQYLAPSKEKRHVPVQRFVAPEEFESYKEVALSMGFRSVASGPLVRSSYLAEQGYDRCRAQMPVVA